MTITFFFSNVVQLDVSILLSWVASLSRTCFNEEVIWLILGKFDYIITLYDFLEMSVKIYHLQKARKS